MSYDYYEEADKIISDLESEGKQDLAQMLKNAIEEGATGLEIFMALRFNLDKILKNRSLSKDVRVNCQKLRDELHRSLEK